MSGLLLDFQLPKMSIAFVNYSTTPLTNPFPINVGIYDSFVYDAVVVHRTGIELPPDVNIHIFYDKPEGNSIEFKLEAEDQPEDVPMFLYMVDRKKTGTEDLEEYLKDYNYVRTDLLDEEEHVDGVIETIAFKEFADNVENHIHNGFDHYLRELLLASVLSGETNAEEKLEDIMKYAEDFQVALTSRDINSKDLYNYEILETVGDKTNWLPCSLFFIRKLKEAGRADLITPGYLSQLHHTYISKNEQIRICKRLGLISFLKSKTMITRDSYEDILEAFCGALGLINFKIRLYKSVDYQLQSRFVEWLYNDYDFTTIKATEVVKEFTLRLRTLAGERVYEMVKGSQFAMRRLKENIPDLMKTNLRKAVNSQIVSLAFGNKSWDEIESFADELDEKVFDVNIVPNEVASITKKKHAEKVLKFIDKFIDIETRLGLMNANKLAEWSEDNRAEFLTIMRKKRYLYLLDKIRIKGHYISYWSLSEVFPGKKNSDERKEELYSTLEYGDTENEEILLALIKDEEDKLLSEQEPGKVLIPEEELFNHNEYYQEALKKSELASASSTNLTEKHLNYSLKGSKKSIENFLTKAIGEGRGKYFIKIHNKGEFIEYSPKRQVKFSENFDNEKLRSMLNENSVYDLIEDLDNKDKIYPLIAKHGIRSLSNLLFFLSKKLTNEYKLTAINNFIDSKDFMDEMTRRLGKTRKIAGKKQAIGFHELLGRNLDKLEKVINYIIINLQVDNSVFYTPEKQLSWLRNAIDFKAGITEVKRKAQEVKKATRHLFQSSRMKNQEEQEKFDREAEAIKKAETRTLARKSKASSEKRTTFSLPTDSASATSKPLDEELPEDQKSNVISQTSDNHKAEMALKAKKASSSIRSYFCHIDGERVYISETKDSPNHEPILLYTTSGGEDIEFSPFVFVGNHNKSRLKSVFAERLIEHEKRERKDLIMERNQRFSNQVGYEGLVQKMKFNGIVDWHLSFEKEVVGMNVDVKAFINLKVFKDNDILFYTGRDIDSILKQLDDF